MALLRFEIADTGIGIAPDDLDKIFEPFQQTGDQQYRQQGTGLGLAITRKLIRLMGGDLHVNSVLGEGSVFWFDLPLPVIATTAAPPLERAARRILGIQGTPPAILIVDDLEDNRRMLTDLLTPIGFAVLTANDGQYALRQALAAHPALVITDIRMPGMDGLELIRQMRQTPELQKIAVIATSASVYHEDQQESFAAGGHAFLPKPIDADDLFDQLQRVLDVAWVYAEEELAAPMLPLIPPPPDDLTALYAAADIGDILDIRERLTELEQRDPAFQPFVEQARAFAIAFQMEQLRGFLDTFQTPC